MGFVKQFTGYRHLDINSQPRRCVLFSNRMICACLTQKFDRKVYFLVSKRTCFVMCPSFFSTLYWLHLNCILISRCSSPVWNPQFGLHTPEADWVWSWFEACILLRIRNWPDAVLYPATVTQGFLECTLLRIQTIFLPVGCWVTDEDDIDQLEDRAFCCSPAWSRKSLAVACGAPSCRSNRRLEPHRCHWCFFG